MKATAQDVTAAIAANPQGWQAVCAELASTLSVDGIIDWLTTRQRWSGDATPVQLLASGSAELVLSRARLLTDGPPV